MVKTLIYPWSLLVLTAGLSAAANLSGPVAGYVAGPSQPELRAISGVPGSYLFSGPLPLPPGTTQREDSRALPYWPILTDQMIGPGYDVNTELAVHAARRH